MERIDTTTVTESTTLDPKLWSTLTRRVELLQHKCYSGIELQTKILWGYGVDVATVVSLNKWFHALVHSNDVRLWIWFVLIVTRESLKLHKTRNISIITPDYTSYNLASEYRKYIGHVDDFESCIPLIRCRIQQSHPELLKTYDTFAVIGFVLVSFASALLKCKIYAQDTK